jgi:hypothetical protein
MRRLGMRIKNLLAGPLFDDCKVVCGIRLLQDFVADVAVILRGLDSHVLK